MSQFFHTQGRSLAKVKSMPANNKMRTPTNRYVMRPNMYDQIMSGPGMVVVYGQHHDGMA